MVTRQENSATARFDEGKTYFVHQVLLLDADGRQKAVQDAAVVFSPGWLFIQEANSDGTFCPGKGCCSSKG